MIRVLVVDDSAFMRHSVSRALDAQPDIEVVGNAHDGQEALDLVRTLRPDVLTMDVEMPRLDGLQALAALMKDHPVPVVMLSSLTSEGAPATIRALELGAVDFIAKPGLPAVGLGTVRDRLVVAIRTAATAKIRRVPPPSARPLARVAPRPPVTDAAPAARQRADRVVAIGCSTGGPRALIEVVPRLPGNLPAAVLIVQHMPAGFTKSLAERLDHASALTVKEAEEGDVPARGLALLAPGGRHMTLDAQGRVRLLDSPPVHGVRPAVDLLFRSLPPVFGRRCVAAILTGMGSDGADGAAVLRAAGARIITEDASTTVVYGMPRAVVERGLSHRQAPLPDVAMAIVDLLLADGGRGEPAAAGHRSAGS
jgi:two-component system, chemotaxis family, protein-glutamate methylesterase/glutaminase